jgi:hypothetical protein
MPARGLANRSRAALGHRSAGKRTGLHGACLTQDSFAACGQNTVPPRLCGNPGLGLSHRGDSRWRVPWRSAGRRARLTKRSRCRASGNWRTMRLSALRLPSFCFFAFLRLVGGRAKLGRTNAPRERLCFIRPRTQCGGGGSPEGRWRGHAAAQQAASSSPLPPPCCAGRSPFPASRGRMKCASLRASAKQSRAACAELDCFVADALRNDEDLKCARHKLVIRALPVFLICWANWPEA